MKRDRLVRLATMMRNTEKEWDYTAPECATALSYFTDALDSLLQQDGEVEPWGWICTHDRGGFICWTPNLILDGDPEECSECCTPRTPRMETFYLHPQPKGAEDDE